MVKISRYNWIIYFAYAVLLFCFIIISYKIYELGDMIRICKYNALPFLTLSLVIFTLIGFLLGLEKLILEIRKEGSWRINLPKVVFIGIPSLYFSIGLLDYYSKIFFISEVLSYPIRILINYNPNFISIFQVIFGYVISSCFVKIEKT